MGMNAMAKKVTRREFVTQTAVVAGAAIAAPHVLAAPSPNSTLGVAVIGVGGMGGYSVDAGLAERIVAIADIDEGNIAGAMKKIDAKQPSAPPKVFYDYRKMLTECRRDIDVVLIATPDHNHAPAAIRAMNLGKHVFCQKPLAHDIYEVHALMKAARRHKVLTQMGNQGHCGEGLRRACEYLWAGAAGNITETHTILGRNFGGKGMRPETKPVPAGVHWEEWIGPSPYREYHEGLHPFSWRSWRQFGTGNVGDMACHNLDALFFALKIAEAKHVTVECLATNGGSEEMWAQDNIVRYEVPARADMPALNVHVYDHKELMPEIMKKTEKDCGINFGECTLYIGDKGLFWTTGAAGQARILPLEKHVEFPAPAATLPRAHGGPVEDLFWCIKNDGVPASNFPDQAGPLTAFALLGHLAQNAGVGKRVEWDVERMRCTNLPEINAYVRRRYRRGWEV
jgi:predicted dehydrogenase